MASGSTFGQGTVNDDETDDESASGARYRTQNRGGKGLRDIKTTKRNGAVIGIVSVKDDDELIMMTVRGKIQRVHAGEISTIGRNTQGVRIMRLEPEDTLAAIVRVPREQNGETELSESDLTVPLEGDEPPAEPPPEAEMESEDDQ